MAKWIPLTALFGLVCLMLLPTPGVLGIIIGVVCTLAILVSGLLMLIDRLAGRVAVMAARMKERRTSKRRRAVHLHSGMAKKI